MAPYAAICRMHCLHWLPALVLTGCLYWLQLDAYTGYLLLDAYSWIPLLDAASACYPIDTPCTR